MGVIQSDLREAGEQNNNREVSDIFHFEILFVRKCVHALYDYYEKQKSS